jgi:glycosyltransferase involved in cell wall biosynthesis
MTTELPLVSVVMPCYNAASYLPGSVGSVLAQSYVQWELVAVDDGSIDGTLAWLRTQSDPRIHILSQSNQGVSAARNAGLARARGRYVAFLDADDTWDTSFLARMVAAMHRNPDAALAYCGWQNLGLVGGRGQPYVPPDYETSAKAETLFAGCRWPIHAALVDHEALRGAGGFDTSLKNAEDYALWLRVGTSAPIVRVPEVLAFYHFHDGVQASANQARAAFHLFRAQQTYLQDHPDFARKLGRVRRRELTVGSLLARGMDCYWKRDLTSARPMFRAVMKRGYGSARDWKYMLPAWLPVSWHRRLLGMRDTGSRHVPAKVDNHPRH